MVWTGKDPEVCPRSKHLGIGDHLGAAVEGQLTLGVGLLQAGQELAAEQP